MVRKDGDTMKECMKTNNPTEFRTIGIDLANGPDMTAETKLAHPWYPAKVVNTTYSVNLRAEPNLDSSVISRIHPDSEFFMSATRNPAWYKVRLKDGTEGFASSKFVSKVMPNEHT